MLNPDLETRRISFVVKTIFAKERRRSGLPQICSGPINLGLPPFEFVLQLCLHLDALEGGDLNLELVVELLQRLLFAKDVRVIETCLLLITI